MSEVTLRLEFDTITCSACSNVFRLQTDFIKARRNDHQAFYCPNGHAQHYPAESEAERLRKALHAAELEKTRLTDLAIKRGAALEVAEAQNKRLRKRAAAGVCPCCNRTFKALSQHMTNQHPEYSK